MQGQIITKNMENRECGDNNGDNHQDFGVSAPECIQLEQEIHEHKDENKREKHADKVGSAIGQEVMDNKNRTCRKHHRPELI